MTSTPESPQHVDNAATPGKRPRAGADRHHPTPGPSRSPVGEDDVVSSRNARTTGINPKSIIIGLSTAWIILAVAAVATVLSTTVPPGITNLFAPILLGTAAIIVAVAVVVAPNTRASASERQHAADRTFRQSEREASRKADRQQALVLLAIRRRRSWSASGTIT